MAWNGMTSILSFVIVDHLVQKLKGRANMQHGDFRSLLYSLRRDSRLKEGTKVGCPAVSLLGPTEFQDRHLVATILMFIH